MDNIKEWTSPPMPELLTRASTRRDWKRICAELYLMSPEDSIGQRTELNICADFRGIAPTPLVPILLPPVRPRSVPWRVSCQRVIECVTLIHAMKCCKESVIATGYRVLNFIQTSYTLYRFNSHTVEVFHSEYIFLFSFTTMQNNHQPNKFEQGSKLSKDRKHTRD